MRRVTLKTLYASPTRSVPAGSTAEFEEAEAEALVAAGYGVYEGDTRPMPQAQEDRPSEKWTVDRLKSWAAEQEIDLGAATKKADILAAIEAAQAQAKPLAEMSVEELEAYADSRDISLPEDMNQAEMVAAIEVALEDRE
ncbi:hypothetical protein [Streptomyces chartreusis]|uniref:hypothetical protein n=1 Tax=Streptomyces chartreusis TaxID=1969 RepID=UPI0038108DB8